MIIGGLLNLPLGKALIGLGVSLAVNVGMGLYAHAIRAEAKLAALNLAIAVDANATGVAARDQAIAAAKECVGKVAKLEADTLRALADRDRAELRAAEARASRARAVRDALSDPDCATNASTPVCPGLVGGQ